MLCTLDKFHYKFWICPFCRFQINLKFNLFSVAFALMFNIEYRFGRYLYSLACYLNLKLFPIL